MTHMRISQSVALFLGCGLISYPNEADVARIHNEHILEIIFKFKYKEIIS